MSDPVDRAAEVIRQRYPSFDRLSADGIAQALADAGLLASPEHDARVLRKAADDLDAEPSARERFTYGSERDIADGIDLGIERAADLLRERAELIEGEP